MLSWSRTFVGAWLVLRANMKWAPFPDNDPDAARALMRRFYRLLSAGLDTRRAAELEVEWWRAHREHQRSDAGREELVSALVELYAYVYSVDKRSVRQAAELRAEAMDVSDEWVDAGCDPSDQRLATERSLLIRSYSSLLTAVYA